MSAPSKAQKRLTTTRLSLRLLNLSSLSRGRVARADFLLPQTAAALMRRIYLALDRAGMVRYGENMFKGYAQFTACVPSLSGRLRATSRENELPAIPDGKPESPVLVFPGTGAAS